MEVLLCGSVWRTQSINVDTPKDERSREGGGANLAEYQSEDHDRKNLGAFKHDLFSHLI